jgi:hypothetical protein
MHQAFLRVAQTIRNLIGDYQETGGRRDIQPRLAFLQTSIELPSSGLINDLHLLVLAIR